MPSFYNPARDSRHRASCFALYRALMRQIPRISLPSDLTSRSDWINPITHLVRSGFRRNKNDTSPRLVTSALKSGYRFLTLLARAQDASSKPHAEVIAFLRDRQEAFPAPRPPPPPVVAPSLRPPPLLTKVSEPGEAPVYKATVRPLPLSELSGGTRKVPMLEDAQGITFLRIGKPQSHSHANFLKRKASRRQSRITTFQELWDDRRHEASEEDQWEAMLEELAYDEDVDISDVGDEGDAAGLIECPEHKDSRETEASSFAFVVNEFGVNHLHAQLKAEMADLQARTTAMLDLHEEEQRLADVEKREKRERRRAEWEERMRLGKGQGSSDGGNSDEQPEGPEGEQMDTGKQQGARDPFESISNDAWADKFAGRKSSPSSGNRRARK